MKNQGEGVDFNTNDLDTQTELEELEDSLNMDVVSEESLSLESEY